MKKNPIPLLENIEYYFLIDLTLLGGSLYTLNILDFFYKKYVYKMHSQY